ncbi:MAG: VOC family protein [Gammaproteobacteria bacterium]|nr:VOC family protein [Gammaproteobacteria bacterium]
MKSKLAHVCIETSDLDETEAFYGLLGLQRRFEFRNQDNDLVGFYLAFGNDTFIEAIKVSELKTEGTIKHFAIEVDDLDGCYQSLTQAGVEVTEKKLEGDNTLMITCHDPNGVYIEIQSYTDASMQFHGGECRVNYRP